MYTLQIDESLNRLLVTLSDTFDEQQAESMILEIEQCLHELSTGFLVLCDISSLKKLECSAGRHYRRFMDLCTDAGVGKVVRIVPDIHNNFGLTVMSLQGTEISP